MMSNANKIQKRIILMAIAIIFFILLFSIVGMIIFKYEVEGETNMPFRINKIMVVSSCEGVSKDNPNYWWDLDIVQNNDIYISIAKNKNYGKLEIIDNISFENFNITNKNNKGKVVIYKPSEDNNRVYEHLEQYEIKDKLIYNGSSSTNLKKLEVANQGGFTVFRLSTEDLAEYISNDDEIKQDATLLEKANISDDDIKYNISFDIIINLKSGVSYKANINLDMPADGLKSAGTASYEITDLSNVVFKRI